MKNKTKTILTSATVAMTVAGSMSAQASTNPFHSETTYGIDSVVTEMACGAGQCGASLDKDKSKDTPKEKQGKDSDKTSES